MKVKYCIKCKTHKTEAEFPRLKHHDYRCRDCIRIYNIDNKEKIYQSGVKSRARTHNRRTEIGRDI